MYPLKVMRQVLSTVTFNAEMLEEDKKNDRIPNSCTKDIIGHNVGHKFICIIPFSKRVWRPYQSEDTF